MIEPFIYDGILIKELKEDIGTGDITTLSTVPADTKIAGRFIAKEEGVICGVPVVKRVFELIDSDVEIKVCLNDGEFAQKGSIIAQISGNARSVLTGERTALNFMQLLSGIATRTRQCVEAVKGTKAVIIDTRKTTPGLRTLEKYAVRVGGGSNHRFNLSDGVLIKDNHIRAAGSIAKAVKAARSYIPHTLKVEVEAESLQMVEEALSCGADIIMLDNMSIEEIEKAVRLVDGRALIEASGNMGNRDLKAIAKTGVDFISIGALTNSIRAMDISLRFDWAKNFS